MLRTFSRLTARTLTRAIARRIAGGARPARRARLVILQLEERLNPTNVQFQTALPSANESASSIQVVVQVSDNHPSQDISVNYHTSDGSATDGTDYTGASGTLSWAHGDATDRTITIPILDDEDVGIESSQQFNITLDTPVNCTFPSGGSSTATMATIFDTDDPDVSLSAASYTVAESAGSVSIPINLDHAVPSSGSPITVSYATADVTAGIEDYTPVLFGSVIFYPGDSSKTVPVPILDDGIPDNGEQFTFSITGISPQGTVVSPSTATVTITDNYMPTISLAASSATVNENAGTVDVTVQLSGTLNSGQVVTAEYATADGSAIAGTDYKSTTGTVRFDSTTGATQTIPVPIRDDMALDDGTPESDSNFTFSLSNPSGARLVSPSAETITITDTGTIISSQAVLAFGTPVVDVMEEVGGVSLTVTRTGDTGATVTVDYATANLTATAGTDYTSTSGTLTFGPTDTVQTITVPILGDAAVDGYERFEVNLSNPTASSGTAIVGMPNPAVVGLLDTVIKVQPTPKVGCGCDNQKDPVGNSTMSEGRNPENRSTAPIRFQDGTVSFAESDLTSQILDAPWGHTRSWTNDAAYLSRGLQGNGWVDTQLPYLVEMGSTFVMVANGTVSHVFDLVSGNYVPRYYDPTVMTYDSADGKYLLTDTNGNQTEFLDFSTSLLPIARGAFAGYQAASGTLMAVTSRSTVDGRIGEVQQQGTVNGQTVTESFVYTYLRSGENAGLLQSVKLRRKIGSGSWDLVRQVQYDYYGVGSSNGRPGDLKTATVLDENGRSLGTSYYRYWTTASSTGYPSGLKYAFGPAAYARLAHAVSDPQGAADSTISGYADYYFEFDSTHRVTKEIASGDGCSACAGGLGTFTYAYTASTNSVDFNHWATKTVETMPDNSVETVYTNAYGQVMLSSQKASASATDEWVTFNRYDTSGRLLWTAHPSAFTPVSGHYYDDTNADLLDFSTGDSPYLSNSAGLFDTFTYGSSTSSSISETVAGDVAGYWKTEAVRQGETGSDVVQESWTYFKRTAGGITVYPTASDTTYQTAGSGGETTSRAYMFFTGSTQVQQDTVTYPTVSTGHNGSGSATSEVTVFDVYGRPVWHKDQDGYLTYTEYDPETGGVVKQITDVNTTTGSADYTGLPTGWSMPTGGGLHLITRYEVDSQGRPTKTTYPNGRVDYTVYNDSAHEVRTYLGWDSTTHLPTGPTEVSRTDTAGGYTETLTMTATPDLNGSNLPTGTEPISDLQTLSRQYVNSAGQSVYSDQYFNLVGLTYTSATTLGTQNTNFWRTTYGYDDLGRPNKTVTPAGTIHRTAYDFLGRVASEWVGTTHIGTPDDDVPTTGYWSPTNPANMTKVAEHWYDGSSATSTVVGDSNQTLATQFPGLGAANRSAETWYDWRDRPVATKAGVETTEATTVHRPIVYTDLDNEGNAIETRQFDGDGLTLTVSGGVPVAPSSSLLRAETQTHLDELGRAYETETFSVDVDATTGAVTVSSNSLKSNTWYNARGLVAKTVSPGGVVDKASFDGAGRTTASCITDGAGDSSYSDALSVTGNTVLEESDSTYDGNGNVLLTTDYARFHNATATGALSASTVSMNARRSYAAEYYDLADRPVADVNVGTNGGSAYTRPSSVPTASDTVLVTSQSYAADAVQSVALSGSPTGGTFTMTFLGQTTSGIAYNATAATVQSALQGLSTVGTGNAVVAATADGWLVRFSGTLAGQYQPTLAGDGSGLTGGTSPAVGVAVVAVGGDAGNVVDVTDPAGLVDETYYNALGQVTRSIQNYQDGVPSAADDKTVEYVYGPAGQTQVKVDLTGGGQQITQTVYGITTSGGSGINSNDVPGETDYPDPTTGSPSSTQKDTWKVDALGETVESTDRNGTVHDFRLDVLGRPTADVASTLGTGIGGDVRRIESAYDGQGNPYLITSYSATTGGYVLNQVERAYNGLGQLTQEWQAVTGAVDTATTPRVQYAYDFAPSGSNNDSRLVSMTYPNGRVLDYNYDSGLDDTLSRLSSLSETAGGSTTFLEEYTYMGLGTVVRRAHPQPGVDLNYVLHYPEATTDAGDQYIGLDRFGRVVDQRWQDASSYVNKDRYQYGYDRNSNRLWRANLVGTGFDELYSYDNLNQLTSFGRGTLNSGHTALTGTPAHTQSWSLDAVGNWNSVTTDGTTETRTHNKQNQLLTATSQTSPTYDAAGQQTGDFAGRTFLYDAWGRVVELPSTAYPHIHYGYDGLGRLIWRSGPALATPIKLYYYSAAWQVLEQDNIVSGVGTVPVTQYVWSPVYVDAMVLRDTLGTSGSRLYLAQDANYNGTALIDTSGTVQERMAYDPYGVASFYDASYTLKSGGSDYGWNHLHQGLCWEAYAGKYLDRNRWYDPVQGRFARVDPTGFGAGGVDLYRYEGNRPVTGVDPTGLSPIDNLWPNFDLSRFFPYVKVSQARNPIGHKDAKYPSLGKTFGFFLWPVTYELTKPANKDKGGWIIQSVRLEGSQGGVEGKPFEFWEGWYVGPNSKVPTKPPAGEVNDIALLKMTRDAGFGNWGDINANDWVSSAPVQGPAKLKWTGRLYFLDCMAEADIPWGTGNVVHTNLPSIVAARDDAKIMKMIADHKGTGPVKHEIELEWNSDGDTTVTRKVP